MTTLFTIGSNGKTAEAFFTLLQDAGVTTVIDTRAKPDSQLAGFARKTNLPYFLDRLAGTNYKHAAELAPDPLLLRAYQNKEIDWDDYSAAYKTGLQHRDVAKWLTDKICLLCACATPDFCHRRVLAEFIQKRSNTLIIKHL